MKRRWLFATLVMTFTAVPTVALALDPGPAPDDGILGTILSGMVNSVRWVFERLGMQPINELVFNLKADRTPVTLELGVFTPNEWLAVKMLWIAFASLLGIMLVGAAIGAGITMANAGADDRKRAGAMQSLQNLLIAGIMLGTVGSAIYLLFELNDLFVKAMATWTPAISFSDMWKGTWVSSAVGRAVVNLFGLITEISLNFTYTMRGFGLMVLVAISPIAIYCFIFDSTRGVTKLWFQELLSNLLMQSVHAILVSLFFWAYGSTDDPSTTWKAFCFLLVLGPTTNMLRAVLTAGRSSNFTGMSLAAAAVGVTSLAGAGRAALGVGTGLNTILKGTGGMGGIMGGFGGGDGPQPGVYGGAHAPAGSAASRASVYGSTPGTTLHRVQSTTEAARNVGGKMGAAVGAVAGAGMALATGDGSFITAAAAAGGKLGRFAGGASAGLSGTLAGSVAEAGGVKAVASVASQAAKAEGGAGASFLGGAQARQAMAGVRGTGTAIGQGFERMMGGHDPGLNEHERAEAIRYNAAGTIGHALAGGMGHAKALGWADSRAIKDRNAAAIAQMGTEHLGRQFREGDRLEFRAYPHRTEIWHNDDRIGFGPASDPSATMENPTRHCFRYNQGDEGGPTWQEFKPLSAPGQLIAAGTVSDGAGAPHPVPEVPRAPWEGRPTGRCRGRIR